MTEAVALAERTGTGERAAEAHFWRFAVLFELGRILESFTRLARDLRQPFYQAQASEARAMRTILAGRLPEGERLADEALEQAQRAQQTARTGDDRLHGGR